MAKVEISVLKIDFDVFNKLIGMFTGNRRNRKLIHEAFQEILKGGETN